MNSKKTLKSILIVLISNVISMLSSILIGFVIPKIMGVSEYGYYKTFTLYSSYIGVLHFGFIDGIYLKFAGQKYEDLDKRQLNTYTRFLFFMQLLVSAIVFSVAFFFLNSSYFIIIILLSLNILATNIIFYYEYISQVTMMFKKTSIRLIIKSVLNIVSVAALFILNKYFDVKVFAYLYIFFVLSINYLMAFWYIITYRDITFGKRYRLLEEKEGIIALFKTGSVLLISNLVAQLVFVVDQQFVNIAFDNDVYAIYAFSYNLISLITVATSAVSMVLFPTLKTLDKEFVIKKSSDLNSILLIFVGFCLSSFFVLCLIVQRFLPKYVDSLKIFRIVLPGVMLSSSISVIKYNCYKVFNSINVYLLFSIGVLLLSIVADFVVFFIFGSTISISAVSILVLLLWYSIVDVYFARKHQIKWVKNLLYILLVVSLFYLVSFFLTGWVGFVVYITAFSLFSVFIFSKLLKNTFRRFKEKSGQLNS